MDKVQQAVGRVSGAAVLLALALLISVVSVGAIPEARAETGAEIVSDDFSRTVAKGWGGAWQECPGRCINYFSVANGKGKISAAAGKSSEIYLAGVSSHETELSFEFSVDKLPVGGPVYVSLVARGEPDHGYRGRVKIEPNGRVEISFQRASAGGRTTEIAALPHPEHRVFPGVKYRGRMQATGSHPTTLRLKTWAIGLSEPDDWHLEVTDDTEGYQGPGEAGIRSYTSSRVRNAPVTVSVDNLKVLDLTEHDNSPLANSHNTGVPPGTHLTVHEGNLRINKAGTVIDALDVRGFVEVRAPNVTIKRSIIRGGPHSRETGLVEVTDPRASVKLIDSTLVPTTPNNRVDGVRGSNFEVVGVEIAGVVDGFDIYGERRDRSSGGNAIIDRVWVHDLSFFAKVPDHTDGTHNDAVQIVGGSNIVLKNNRFDVAERNAGVQISDYWGDVAHVTIQNNYTNGGGCSFNFDEQRGTLNNLMVTDNQFGPSSKFNCGIIIDRSIASPVLARNTWTVSGLPTKVVWR